MHFKSLGRTVEVLENNFKGFVDMGSSEDETVISIKKFHRWDIKKLTLLSCVPGTISNTLRFTWYSRI